MFGRWQGIKFKDYKIMPPMVIIVYPMLDIIMKSGMHDYCSSCVAFKHVWHSYGPPHNYAIYDALLLLEKFSDKERDRVAKCKIYGYIK